MKIITFLSLEIQIILLNKLYVWATYLFYLTFGHLYFWISSSIYFLPLFTMVIFLLFFFQGNTYTSMPFYAMRRNINKKQKVWEAFDFDLNIDDTLLSATYKDEYQSWKELGDRSNTFYQIRSRHYLRHIHETYETANYEPREFSKIPLCAPHYQDNILNYDLEEDLMDLMPSITSLCQDDASSVLWQLKPDLVRIKWTNETLAERLADRQYRLSLINGPGYFVSWQRRYYANLSKPLVRFPDIPRAFWPERGVKYIPKSHPGYPINNPRHSLVYNWTPNFDSITTRLDIYPHLVRYDNDQYIYQDIHFASFKNIIKSVFAFSLFLRYFRKLNFLIRQNLYTEVEHDPFFFRMLNIHNLAYPILKFKLNLTSQKKNPKKLFKTKNNINKPKKRARLYNNLIKLSRGQLIRDIFIQTSHTLTNDEGFLDDSFFQSNDPYSNYAQTNYPFISSRRQYCEDRVQAQSALLPLQFEFEEDRNIELFLEDNVEPFSYNLLSTENPSLLDNYEIIVEGLDNFQDGDSNLTDPIMDFLRLIQTYYLFPISLFLFLKTTSLLFFLTPFIMSDIYTVDDNEDSPKENLKYPSTLIINNKKKQTFFTDDYFWLYASNEYTIIDEECYEDIISDVDLESYDDGWNGSQTDNDFFFDTGIKKTIRNDNLIAEERATGGFFKGLPELYEATYDEDNLYSYSFFGKDKPAGYKKRLLEKKLTSLEMLQISSVVQKIVFWIFGDPARFYFLSTIKKKTPMHAFLPRGYDFDGDDEMVTDDASMFKDPEDYYVIHNLMENYAGFELHEGDTIGHEESIYLDEEVYDGIGPECYKDIDGETEFITNYSFTPYPVNLFWNYDITLQYPTSPRLEKMNFMYISFMLTNREDDLEEFLLFPTEDETDYVWYEHNGEIDDFELTEPYIYDEEFGEDITETGDEMEMNEVFYNGDQFEPENRSIYEDDTDDFLEDEDEDHDITFIHEKSIVEKEVKKGEATLTTRICAYFYNLLRSFLKY